MGPKEKFLEVLEKDHGINLDAMTHDVKRYLPDFNEIKFREAFYFAAKAHEGQFRKENKPYITHPVEAVRILISMHGDEDTLIAAFLHDVPEDTPHTIEEIEGKFGKKVAFLVEGITKLSKVHFRSDMADRQIESLKKLFIHSAEDPRIILIKLADRLHNMRTLQYLDKPEKQHRIARETLEIFVPIANLLGIEELKSELEDLCFRFLYPEDYENLIQHLNQSKAKNQQILEETIEIVQKNLDRADLKAAVCVRQRNLFHIYKKMVAQGKRPAEIEEVIALRILIPEGDNCYKALGIIHALFKPKPRKFKDYIAVPKINGYQSLHTTVFGLHGMITKFQIRTNKMHLEAEYGIAAHYFYDQQEKQGASLEKDKRSYWMEKILEMQKNEAVNNSYLEDLKVDIFQDRIFVFTPQGDPIDLPKDASCVDFAYSIHTNIGHRALEANVNGELVPMTTILHTGDTVKILTSETPKQPSREWLSYAKTNTAKSRIREYLKRETHDAKIRTGRRLLQKEFDRAGFGLIKNITKRKIRGFLEKYPQSGYRNFEDIQMAIGEGTLNTMEFMNSLYFQSEEDTKNLPTDPQKNKPHLTTVSAKIIFDKNDPRYVQNLLKVIADFGITLTKARAYFSLFKRDFVCHIIIDVKSFQQLSQLFANIENIPGVKRVERLFWQRQLLFTISSFITFLVWALHPYILYSYREFFTTTHQWLASTLLYFSLALLFGMIVSLKRLINRSFPELRETSALWMLTFVLSFFVLMTFFGELFFFHLEFNWLIASGIILIILSYLALEYIDYHDSYLQSK